MGRSHEPKFNPNHKTNMTTRNGKIARLPFNIREDLNNRLLENVPVKDILVFLNTDSTVKYCMDMLFQGRQITEQCTARKRLCLPYRGAPYA